MSAPGKHPPAFLAEVKARVGLAGLVGGYVQLRRDGREWIGLCPFHAERSPSFTVNEGKGFYHCFGFGAHGDAIGFVIAIDGLSFVAAVRELAPHAGMPLPHGAPPARFLPTPPPFGRPS